MERRNVFSLFQAWLKSSSGAAQAKALIASVDVSGDGQLEMGELKTLLMKVCLKHTRACMSGAATGQHARACQHVGPPACHLIKGRRVLAP